MGITDDPFWKEVIQAVLAVETYPQHSIAVERGDKVARVSTKFSTIDGVQTGESVVEILVSTTKSRVPMIDDETLLFDQGGGE